MGNTCCDRRTEEVDVQGKNAIELVQFSCETARNGHREESFPEQDSKELEFGNGFEKHKNASRSSSSEVVDSSGYSSTSTYYTSKKGRTVFYEVFVDNLSSLLHQKRGLISDHESRIKRNFRYLKEELDLDCGLLDHFIQENIFTTDQVELINSAGPRRRKIDCFLRMLLRCRENAYALFLDFLTDTSCDHVRTVLESETTKPKLDVGTSTFLGSFKALNAILIHKSEIIHQLEPDHIVDFFVQYEEFTIDEYEFIISQLTRRNKAEKLMEILASGNHMPRGYYILLKALHDTEELYLQQLLSKNHEHKPALNSQDDTGRQPPRFEFPEEENFPSDDDNEILIKTTIISKVKNWNDVKRQKKHVEEFIVETVNMDKGNVDFELNDGFFSDTHCLIKSVDKGSIIIRVKGCGHGSLKQLMETGYRNGLEKILNAIFLHPKVNTFADSDVVLITDVKYLQTKNEDKKKDNTSTSKELISTNRAFLIEELDPIIFLQLGIFTKTEVDAIRLERNSSRAKATRRMLEIVLVKTEDEVGTFMSEIKLRKEFVWKHICPNEAAEDSEEELISGYEFLVENICPAMISDYCKEKGLLPNYTQFVSTTRQRSDRAKFILQEIMKKGHVESHAFLSIVSTFDGCLCTLLSAQNEGKITQTQLQEESGDEIGLKNITKYPSMPLKAHDKGKPSEIVKFKNTTELEQTYGHEDHRTKYKTEINIIDGASYVSKSVIQGTEHKDDDKSVTKDDDKRVTNENDNESGYESLSLNRRTEMLERFSMRV